MTPAIPPPSRPLLAQRELDAARNAAARSRLAAVTAFSWRAVRFQRLTRAVPPRFVRLFLGNLMLAGVLLDATLKSISSSPRALTTTVSGLARQNPLMTLARPTRKSLKFGRASAPFLETAVQIHVGASPLMAGSPADSILPKR